MLRNMRAFYGRGILAEDGDIGKVDDFFFDDDTWTVRYLVADTGHWLPGRKVLISTAALGRPDPESGDFPVALTREQVRNSPDIDMDMPVSRQDQVELHAYYGWPAYWTFGGYYNVAPPPGDGEEEEEISRAEQSDPHLRSAKEVGGYHIQGNDGEIGHVEDFIVEDESWTIRYAQVDTRNWLPGKRVLIPRRWITEISWTERLVYVELTTDEIKDSPGYDPSEPVSREYEIKLYEHYGRPRNRQEH